MLCGMRPTDAHRVLEQEGEILGYFEAAGMDDNQAAPGVLRYSPEDGTTVRLIAAPPGWPTTLGGRGELVVHGVTSEGHPFTLLDARVSSLALGDRPTRLRAATLALGAHFDAETTWSSASYGTAHLHEWVGEAGLSITDWQTNERGQTQRFAHEWTPPPSYVVELEDARLTIGPAMSTEAAHAAEQHVRTDTRLRVRPARPMTVGALERRFARPLLAFSVLAADRPDAITYEAVSDADRRERAVILRAGRMVTPRPWQPDSRFLFRAEQIADIAETYTRWIALWDEAGPEIATFVDTVNDGSTYSRARLLASVVTLEAYWRTRLHRPTSPGQKRQRLSLTKKLKALRDHSGVDPARIGGTNKDLKLLVAGRNLYAHLSQTLVELCDEEIDDGLVDNCRRATALIQACLLHDLGVPPERINEMFAKHLASWPLD
jgi:hypothetical protein